MNPERADATRFLPPDLRELLGRLDEGLEALYGERYRGLVLYGSYARGEADEGSDVDLLLLLDGEVNPTREILRSENVKWPLSRGGLHRIAHTRECGNLPHFEAALPLERAQGGSAYLLSEIEALFEKAGRSFAAAEQLLEGGDADFAASQAYYSYFYVAEALLLSKELNFSRHSQVISQYGLHFAKTEVLDRRFHRLLDEAFTLRQTADYSTITRQVPSPNPVRCAS